MREKSDKAKGRNEHGGTIAWMNCIRTIPIGIGSVYAVAVGCCCCCSNAMHVYTCMNLWILTELVGRLVHCLFAHNVGACQRACDCAHTTTMWRLQCSPPPPPLPPPPSLSGTFWLSVLVSGSILSRSRLWCQFLGIDVYKNIASRQYAMEWQASRARVRLFYSQLIQNSFFLHRTRSRLSRLSVVRF